MYADKQTSHPSAAAFGYGTGAAMNAGSTIGGDAARRPELSEEMETLDKSLAHAEESLSMLAARLGGVLRPPAPETNGNGALAAVGPSTHYAQQVHDFRHRALRMGDRIQDLLRRLEV